MSMGLSISVRTMTSPVLMACWVLVVLLSADEVSTVTQAPSPDGSPMLHSFSLAGDVPPGPQSNTTTPNPQSSGDSIFGGRGAGSSSHIATQSASSGTLGVFDNNVPYDLKDTSNPHWRHFLSEVAVQTSRDLTDLQANGVNDPIIGAMWDVYVQTVSDGTGLPTNVGGSTGYSGGTYGSPSGGSSGSGSGVSDPMSSGVDANMAPPSSMYGMWGWTATPSPPALNDKWFLEFFNAPASSSRSGATSSALSTSSGTSSAHESQSLTQSSPTSNTVTQHQSYQPSTSQTRQYSTSNTQNAVPTMFSQFGSSPTTLQQIFGMTGTTSNQNSFNTALFSMMSPMMASSMSSMFSPSYQTMMQQPTQQPTPQPSQENPLLLLQSLMAPQNTAASAPTQQTSAPEFKLSSASWSFGSSSNQQPTTYLQPIPTVQQALPQVPATSSTSTITSASTLMADLSRQLMDLMGTASSAAPAPNPAPTQPAPSPSLPSFMAASFQNVQAPAPTVSPPPSPSISISSLGPSSLGPSSLGSSSLDPSSLGLSSLGSSSLGSSSLGLSSFGPSVNPVFLGPSSAGGMTTDPVNSLNAQPRLSFAGAGGPGPQNAIDSLSNSPGMPPAAVNMATSFNPVTFYYDTMFNARASRDLGCRTMSEMLDMDVPMTMDLICTSLCPAVMPGAVTGKRFGTTCLCCPIYVSDQAIGLRGMMQRNRHVVEGLS